MKNIKSYIREIPDWPKPGVNFKDITTLLQNKKLFRELIDLISRNYINRGIDKVVGIDARGFLIASPVAYVINAGLVIVRKSGKLPYDTIGKEYTLEYASNIIEMHKDSIIPGEKILLVDDLIATGGTALAACDLIESMGGKILGVSAIIDLPFLGGSKKLTNRGYDVKSLVSYDSE